MRHAATATAAATAAVTATATATFTGAHLSQRTEYEAELLRTFHRVRVPLRLAISSPSVVNLVHALLFSRMFQREQREGVSAN